MSKNEKKILCLGISEPWEKKNPHRNNQYLFTSPKWFGTFS